MKNKLFISVFTGLLLFSCKSKNEKVINTTSVKHGTFNIEVVETGEIKATQALNISAPALSWHFGQLKITYIIEDGTEVEKGDTTLLFDPTEVKKAIVDTKAELDIAKAELEKQTAEQQLKIKDLESDLKVSEIDLKISEIELSQAIYESEITKKEIRLNLDKAKISLNKAKKEIENQKLIHYEEQQQQQLKIKQLERRLDDAKKTLDKLTVTSPADGIAIIRSKWRSSEKWQVGDQTWSGNPIIDLPDLSELKAVADISEVDIGKIKPGLPVEIKPDAFSDTSYTGKVIKVANLAEMKDDKTKIKTFPIEVLIDGAPKQLLPGMNVATKIIIDKIDSVVYVPIEAVFKDEEGEMAWVKSGGSFKKKRISTGACNNDYIIINEGLTPRETVALIDPFESDEDKKERNRDNE